MKNKKKLISQIHKQPKVINKNEITLKQDSAKSWFLNLRDIICKTFVQLEYEHCKNSFNNKKPANFVKKKSAFSNFRQNRCFRRTPG